MVQKQEDPPIPDYYRLINEDPTVPKSNVLLGPPEEVLPSQPMVDLSRPEDFPEEVRAIIAASPKRPLFTGIIDKFVGTF